MFSANSRLRIAQSAPRSGAWVHSAVGSAIATRQSSQPSQYAAQQAKVERDHKQIVGNHPKIGMTGFRVTNSRPHVAHRYSTPLQSNRYFGIEIHSLSEFVAVSESDGFIERVNAVTEQRVGNRKRKCFEPNEQS